MKVGDTFYTFDGNRRVYAKDEKGYGVGGPIYAEKFIPFKIVGETDKEFLVDGGGKINKRSGKFQQFDWSKDRDAIYTEQEREDIIWENTHRYKILRLLDQVDGATLRKIAEIIGYTAGEAVEEKR